MGFREVREHAPRVKIRNLRSSSCWKCIEIANPTTDTFFLYHSKSFTIPSGGPFWLLGGGGGGCVTACAPRAPPPPPPPAYGPAFRGLTNSRGKIGTARSLWETNNIHLSVPFIFTVWNQGGSHDLQVT